MISDDELWKKCKSNSPITREDLGIPLKLKDCTTIIEHGFRTFYSDGINYFDVNGYPVSEKYIDEVSK